MKNILFAIALCGVFLIITESSVCQPPPPPPPPAPLIYSAPEKSDMKEFVSKEAHFAATFPGTPKTTTSKSAEFVLTRFSLRSRGSNYAVSFIEYPASIESRKETMIENYKRGILEHPLAVGDSKFPSKIIEDREISIDGFNGREMTYQSDLEFTRARIIFSGKHVYEIKTDVTNWHLLTKHYPEKVSDFNKESDRFLNSFKILK